MTWALGLLAGWVAWALLAWAVDAWVRSEAGPAWERMARDERIAASLSGQEPPEWAESQLQRSTRARLREALRLVSGFAAAATAWAWLHKTVWTQREASDG